MTERGAGPDVLRAGCFPRQLKWVATSARDTERYRGRRTLVVIAFAAAVALLVGCAGTEPAEVPPAPTADIVLVNARVYTFDWPAPARDGTPARTAPFHNGRWQPDASALAIADGHILFVGNDTDALRNRGPQTRVLDLQGATVLPGLVDSHTHVFSLGAKLRQVDLTGVTTHADAIARVVARARVTPKGQWIIGSGWDEGAWANNYPDKEALSAAVPDHPVMLDSLHGFAAWANDAALTAAGITRETPVPVGGVMRRGADGEPNGLFLNRATTLLDEALPELGVDQLAAQAVAGLSRMAQDGYVTVHEAGVSSAQLAALEKLEREDRLPIRVYAMLSLRDEPLIRTRIDRGPVRDPERMLVARSVKAYYDGALGSRGARLLADYSDEPGHRGVSGEGYGFDQALNQEAMRAGFQVAIHAIGDAGNREALNILAASFALYPQTAFLRHRIEHAQVLHPDDIPRLAQLGVIASMEPPHAMEDKAWAEARLGPKRIRGAYAWRSLRLAGATLTFNSDNPGSDHNIFYGLHSAITRQDRQLEPSGGWYPEQRMTGEEALRAYTLGAAFASFREDRTGSLAVGRWADLTVMDIDPLNLATTQPAALLDGRILMTMVDGKIVFQQSPPGVAGGR